MKDSSLLMENQRVFLKIGGFLFLRMAMVVFAFTWLVWIGIKFPLNLSIELPQINTKNCSIADLRPMNLIKNINPFKQDGKKQKLKKSKAILCPCPSHQGDFSSEKESEWLLSRKLLARGLFRRRFVCSNTKSFRMTWQQLLFPSAFSPSRLSKYLSPFNSGPNCLQLE